MDYNKTDIEKLRTDPLASFFFNALGINKDEFIAEATRLAEQQNSVTAQEPTKQKVSDPIADELERYVKAGIIEKCGTTDAGETLYRFTEKANEEEPVLNVQTSEEKPQFIMGAVGLKNFIKEYMALESKIKKLKYSYGVDFGVDGTEGSIHTEYNNIIWKLIRLIFGDENASDITDYCYGNSNFDSVEALYNELT